MSILISKHSEWARVAKELEAEDLKLASYDGTLLDLLGDAKGRGYWIMDAALAF